MYVHDIYPRQADSSIGDLGPTDSFPRPISETVLTLSVHCVHCAIPLTGSAI